MRALTATLTAMCCLLMASSLSYTASGQPANSRLATASFALRVPNDGARDELVKKLTKLAETEGLSIHISHLRDSRHVFVDMRGKDIDIVASNPFPSPIEFDIFIYKNRENVSALTIDNIVNGITQIVYGIDGIIVGAIKK